MGWPFVSVTLPEIAPVVTPCATTGSAISVENKTAATQASGARTIQGIGGYLPWDTEVAGGWSIDAAEAEPRWEARQGRAGRSSCNDPVTGFALRPCPPPQPD